jgi:hypothetical protein
MSEIINEEIFNEWRSNWKTLKEIKKSGADTISVEHLLDMLFAKEDDTQQFEQFMEMKGMSVEKCIVKECLEYKDDQLICCVKECESVSSNIQHKHLDLSKEIKYEDDDVDDDEDYTSGWEDCETANIYRI